MRAYLLLAQKICQLLKSSSDNSVLLAVGSHHMLRVRLKSFAPQASSLLPCTRCSSFGSLVNTNIEPTPARDFRSTSKIIHRVANREICRYWQSSTFTSLSSAAMPSLNEHKESQNTEASTEPKKPALDLAALAREREERQKQKNNKRDRSISPPATRKTLKLDSETVSLPSGAKLTSFSTVVREDQRTRKSQNARAANEKLLQTSSSVPTEGASKSNQPHAPAAVSQPKVKSGDVNYPRGVVKKTWAFGHERTGNDIKLEEVLESKTLKTAVLSAFQWDMDWLFRKLNINQTKFIFVMQAKDQPFRDQMLEETKDMRKFLRLCFPSMDGLINCMHSKLMLLFHPDKLRIAIPTANLLDFDWGESGVMENSVWLIDLPRLPGNTTSKVEDLTDFGKELMYFLGKQDLPQDATEGVLNFDFAATKDMAFVHTVGGMLYGDEAERTGLPGLAQAVRQHNLTTTDLNIDFAASSMGSLKDEFLKNVHAAAKGENMVERAEAATSKAKSSFFQAKKSGPNDHSIRDKVRLYFPTHDTVTSSTAGGAGTICLNRKWFEDMTFPRRCFRDYISNRPGLLSHNKILYARGLRKADAADGEESTAGEKIAWAYVGSANMSESAWGKLVYDRKEKKWKLNCKNWECGVLLPVSTDGVATEAGKDGVVGMEAFKDVVEPPFMYPGVEYEDREPWYFQEKH